MRSVAVGSGVASADPAPRAVATAAVTTLSVYRFDGFWAKAWAFCQMGWAHLAMRRQKGIRFYKLMGTGTGEGFDPKPNWSTYAILTVWETREDAEIGLQKAPFTTWAAKAVETTRFFMQPVQVWGDTWSGDNPFGRPEKPKADDLPTPMAVLTRATIKFSKMREFWSNVPDINPDIRSAEGKMTYKIGLGEVPLLHQVTFSIWNDIDAVRHFAYRAPAHAEAIKAATTGDGFFKDSLFVRFKLLEERH